MNAVMGLQARMCPAPRRYVTGVFGHRNFPLGSQLKRVDWYYHAWRICLCACLISVRKPCKSKTSCIVHVYHGMCHGWAYALSNLSGVALAGAQSPSIKKLTSRNDATKGKYIIRVLVPEYLVKVFIELHGLASRATHNTSLASQSV